MSYTDDDDYLTVYGAKTHEQRDSFGCLQRHPSRRAVGFAEMPALFGRASVLVPQTDVDIDGIGERKCGGALGFYREMTVNQSVMAPDLLAERGEERLRCRPTVLLYDGGQREYAHPYFAGCKLVRCRLRIRDDLPETIRAYDGIVLTPNQGVPFTQLNTRAVGCDPVREIRRWLKGCVIDMDDDALARKLWRPEQPSGSSRPDGLIDNTGHEHYTPCLLQTIEGSSKPL